MSKSRNKIDYVKTIALVARELAVDEEWLAYIADGMEPDDGLIWVHSDCDKVSIAFSEFGVANLEEVIEIYRSLAK